MVELQSEREERERRVTEGEGSMQARAESWWRVRERDSVRLGGEVLRRKRPVRWKSPSFFFLCSWSCSSWSIWAHGNLAQQQQQQQQDGHVSACRGIQVGFIVFIPPPLELFKLFT